MSIDITQSQLVSGSNDSLRDLDLFADVAKRNLNCDMVFIRIAQQNRIFSLGEDLEDAGRDLDDIRSALSSICKATSRIDRTIFLSDASTDERFRDELSVSKGPIAGYLGAPLQSLDEKNLGNLFAICRAPRVWKSSDVKLLEQLARIASSLIVKELQKSELASLHDSLREADLVAMSLAREMTSLVSVHSSDGEVLFSSIALMRLAAEQSIAEVGLKLIQDNEASQDVAPEYFERHAAMPSVNREFLRLRNSQKIEFDVSFTKPIDGVFFLEWKQRDAPVRH